MWRYFLQETKYGTPAVCLGAPAPESKNLEDSVTKVKQDNAGHMHTNTLTHTIRHEHTHTQTHTVRTHKGNITCWGQTNEKMSFWKFEWPVQVLFFYVEFQVN